MKKHLKLLTVLFCAIVATFALALGACGETGPNEQQKPETGTIHGTVLDQDAAPIEEAEIYLNDDEEPIESDEEGKFEIKNVTVGDVTLKVVALGYTDAVKELTADNFDENGDASVNIVMVEGRGTVTGIVSMAGNTTQHLAGATVKLGTQTVTTDENGSYTLENVRMLKTTQTLTVSLAGYADGRANISARSFSNGTARVNIQLVQNDREDFPGIKPYQLETLTALNASKTTYTSGEIGAEFLSAPDGLGGSGKVETHGEGYCVNANTSSVNDNMVAFVFAKVNVTGSNKFLTAYARIFFGQNGGDTRGADGTWTRNNAVVAKLGLNVFEVGDNNTFTLKKGWNEAEIVTESFMPVTFDLSSEVGKTVVVVLGTRTGYHCCLDRIEFSDVEPQYLTVKDVNGLDSLRLYDKVTENTFDAAALKDKWATGGGTTKIDEGIQLNGTDPWKAVDFNAQSPQPVNSYMYIRKDITAQQTNLKVTATIVKLADTHDTAQNNKQFLPWICVIVLNAEGDKVYQSEWKQVVVEEDKTPVNFTYELNESCVGEDMTVIIAANVGYRATITNVEFAAPAAPSPAPALLPKKREL